jgi:hypothetical protein
MEYSKNNEEYLTSFFGYTESFNGPSLLSPNGGEIFLDNEMTISWLEPNEISSSKFLNWYEIFFTDSYSWIKQPEWLQIATIPIGNSSFVWDVPPYIKSRRCRLGIRAVDNQGKRSKISLSANNFSIRDKRLPKPAVIEPVTNGSYFSYVPFILDYKGIEGQCSERAFYQIYYSSKKQSIEWTLLYNNIPVDTDPIKWDIQTLSSSDDYSIKIELVDDDNISEPVFINNVNINTLNYFIVDTVPPRGRIQVVDNLEYIKTRDILLNIKAYDETTDTEFMRIEQFNVTGATTDTGPYQNFTNLSAWYIKGDDGVKLIQTRLKDYVGNVLLDSEEDEFFRTYKSLNNVEVNSSLLSEDGSNIWTAFGGSNPQLYLNTALLSTLTYEATALAVFDDILYVAVKDNDNNGILQRYTGGTLNTIYEIDEEDSVINTMEVFDSKLFLGLQNGKLMSFNGTSIATENPNDVFDYSIYYLKTDGNILYICLDNYIHVYTLRKDSTNIYRYERITIDN